MQNSNEIKKTHIPYFITAAILFLLCISRVLGIVEILFYPLAIIFFIFGAFRLRRYNKQIAEIKKQRNEIQR
ncbi:hypothetical protein A3B87_01135 [Candidatus Kuenenbacteria bacterium RIFCSPHIGHO2_02_FULL_39_13]|uniref:Uncharacterized protein n=1 Tax=Candidatus Kuenenbacteria bacterium RIFCSPHIGHO2_02_FULL_39_13 TaxID=1798561 RepID=A0A1F6FLN1_9BACT|nr:MAG: hypothetical protein A3B87_01135 [Candidatus Kuenenbacteria bacterium RIFCSPHIGHO2_02_FULL_39_13]